MRCIVTRRRGPRTRDENCCAIMQGNATTQERGAARIAAVHAQPGAFTCAGTGRPLPVAPAVRCNTVVASRYVVASRFAMLKQRPHNPPSAGSGGCT